MGGPSRTEHPRRSAEVGDHALLGRERPNDYTSAFAAMSRDRLDALFVANSPVNFGHRNKIVELVTKARLPATYHAQEFVLAGGLMSYGTNVPELFRQAAIFVVKVLKRAKPADLPVEQPAKFDMAINMKTARELRLTIPQSVLLRADRDCRRTWGQSRSDSFLHAPYTADRGQGQFFKADAQ